MARRNRELSGLAALAALGALGYHHMARGSKRGPGEAEPPVEDRGDMLRQQAALAQAAVEAEPVSRGENYGIEGRREGYAGVQGISAPERVRSMAPARVQTAVDAEALAGEEPRRYPGRGPGYEEIAAFNRATAPRRNVAGDYTRKMGATAEEMAAYRNRPMSGSAMDQIPKSTGSRYGTVASDTDPSLREDGTELGRNVKNTLAALTPLGGGFGKVGAELATAKGAAERAARSRQLAEELRRTQQPTKFTSTKPGAAKSRSKKFNEEEAGMEFKRGGKIKKMASGGMTSASKRADGIAVKGKTKCKMY